MDWQILQQMSAVHGATVRTPAATRICYLVTFNYTPLTSGNYSKSANASFPEQDYQDALYVVSSINASDGIGGTYTTSYWYYGAKLHLQGRGLEGFYARQTHDSRNGLYAYDYFHTLFPHTGALYQRDVYQANHATLISRTQNTWTHHAYGSGAQARLLSYTSTSTTQRYEAGGAYNSALISTSTTVNNVHAATGVVYDSTTTTTEASTANGVQAGASYVQRVYQPTAELLNDTANWCIGGPGRIESTNSHNQYAGAAITRTTEITWDAGACRPTQVVAEPGDSQLAVTLTLGYDAFGNVNSQTVTGVGMTGRTTSSYWGATGQFPESVTNALSQTSSLGWDYSLGVQTSYTDPNGVSMTTSWQYDPFGRRTRETRPDGTATTWTYADCSASGCISGNNKLIVTETALDSNGAVITDGSTYLDRFDRPIATSARALSGAYTRINREYDALGRLYRESAPCWWSSCVSYWTTFSYDTLNRPTQVSRPVSDSDPTIQTTYTYYEGLTTRVIDVLSKQSTKVANVLGGLSRSSNHDSYYQSFDYDPFGNVRQVTDSLGNTLLSNTYNIRGMRTAQTDLVAGSWAYTPNALGEIVSQIDAKSQTTTFEYDALGRMKSRVEPEGASTFVFGTSAAQHNIGRLISMSGLGYTEGFIYDSIGRVQTRTITSDVTYSIDYSYNALGAVDTLTYPTSTSSYRLKLQYEYQNGLLMRVKDYNAPATVFWTADDTDARGNIIAETLGNGIQTVRGYDQVTGWIDFIQSSGAGASIQDLSYSWDRVGNLTQRQDLRQALTENFYYDNLHRLTSVTGEEPISVGYDARGNIISRTGAVTSGDAHTITWYSSNLPNTISGPAGYSSQFFYGPDRSRYRQNASYGGTAEETIYIGGLVEKVTLGAVTSWKHYIAGSSGVVAVYTRKSNGTDELYYLTKDHLGSIDSVTNASGALAVRLSYNSWGQRRNEDTWAGNPTSADWTGITNTTRHGFTFHEMLDNLNLTHMNGRVYDQMIGRFISADPLIDGSVETTGWNRYSYVHNRVVSATDPSGYGKERPNVQHHDRNNRTSDILWDMASRSAGASLSITGQVAWQHGELIDTDGSVTSLGYLYHYIPGSNTWLGRGRSFPAGPSGDGGGSGGGGGGPGHGPRSTEGGTQEEKSAKCWNADIGVSGTAQAILGVSGGSAVGVSYGGDLLNSRFFFKFQANGLYGLGLFAGVGVSAEGGPGAVPAGLSSSYGFHMEANRGAAIAWSAGYDYSAPGGVTAGGAHERVPFGRLGVGAGYSFGAGAFTQSTVGLPSAADTVNSAIDLLNQSLSKAGITLNLRQIPQPVCQ